MDDTPSAVSDEALWELFGAGGRGVLVTVKRDGRPQLSNIGYDLSAERVALISVTEGRAKTRNMRRDPRASLYVTTPDLGAYAVAEGTAELGAVAATPDDPVVDDLVAHYRRFRGEHDDWDEFRDSMVREKRLLVRLPVTRVYGWRPSI